VACRRSQQAADLSLISCTRFLCVARKFALLQAAKYSDASLSFKAANIEKDSEREQKREDALTQDSRLLDCDSLWLETKYGFKTLWLFR
jgi:hypothetical protein